MSSVIQVIDVNDNRPVFSASETTVSVTEDVSEGFLVATVVARDSDTADNARLRYCIVSGNEKRHFAIDDKSGTMEAGLYFLDFFSKFGFVDIYFRPSCEQVAQTF